MRAGATTERPRPAEDRAFTVNRPCRAERRAFRVPEFAVAYRISTWSLYALWRRGEGPARFRVGSRWFISVEAAEAWRAGLEAAAEQEAAK